MAFFSKSRYRGYGRRRKNKSRTRLVFTLAIGSGLIYYFFLRNPAPQSQSPTDTNAVVKVSDTSGDIQPEDASQATSSPIVETANQDTLKTTSQQSADDKVSATNNSPFSLKQQVATKLNQTASSGRQSTAKAKSVSPPIQFTESAPTQNTKETKRASQDSNGTIQGLIKVLNTDRSQSVADNPFLSSSQLIPRPNSGKQSPAQLVQAINNGIDLMTQGKHIEGRKILTNILINEGDNLSNQDAFDVRDLLMRVNRELLFSNYILPGDPVIKKYKVKPGEIYGMIAPRNGLTSKFLEALNGIPANRLPAGKNIKVLNGPFHAVVDKSDYRMDTYLIGDDKLPVYVRSFAVGLGENNSTPVGRWRVRPNSKVQNPSWRNPRTGKYYMPDDPDNPIGDYWLGLEGTDDNTRDLQSYGIHGTNDPESIGKQKSMGCVRMRDNDVRLVFHMLVSTKSTVIIRD